MLAAHAPARAGLRDGAGTDGAGIVVLPGRPAVARTDAMSERTPADRPTGDRVELRTRYLVPRSSGPAWWHRAVRSVRRRRAPRRCGASTAGTDARTGARGAPRTGSEPPREQFPETRALEIPSWARSADLDPSVRSALRSLSARAAEEVSGHLAAAAEYLDEDPALALTHARVARSHAARVAVVREAVGIAAYHAGEWNEALSELRAAHRMSGETYLVPLLMDTERALGRPRRP